MRHFRIVGVAAILVTAAIAPWSQASATKAPAAAARVAPAGYQTQMVTRRPSGPVVRDHRANSAPKKVIRAGRNYDKVRGRDQVIVNGKRVPRKTG
jgi:hypothetical protein